MNTEADYAWAAGLIDGEGCLQLTRQQRPDGGNVRHCARITVNMVHKPTVERLHQILGGSVRPFRRRDPSIKHRAQWTWEVASTGAYSAARNLLPYLVTKRVEAELIIQFANLLPAKKTTVALTAAQIAERDVLAAGVKTAKRYEWWHPYARTVPGCNSVNVLESESQDRR